MRFKITDSGTIGYLNEKMYGHKEENYLTLNEVEALYLLKKDRINKKHIKTTIKELEKKLKDKEFYKEYKVYKDLRDNGYYVKSGAKFGELYRVYDNPKDHSKWIVFPKYYDESIEVLNLVAKGRVVHSTKKGLLIAIIDSDDEVVYYEMDWVKI